MKKFFIENFGCNRKGIDVDGFEKTIRQMKLAHVIMHWDVPHLMRQTPGGLGRWGNVQFTLDESVKECDYVIISTCLPKDSIVKCPSDHIWAIIQEPPNEVFKCVHKGDRRYHRIYTTDSNLKGKRYIHSQPAINWQVNKDYDELVKNGMPEKRRQLSCIISTLTRFRGHYNRMKFLDAIRGKVKFDLIATYEYYLRGKHDTKIQREQIRKERSRLGFVCVEDKWEGLAPYRYSIAIENYSGPYYWSEKIADCFLAWTMPIYYGCTNIAEYFPPQSMICVDINDPANAAEKIKEAVNNNLWEKNLDAIAHARELVLNKYQLFPFMAEEIKAFENSPKFKNSGKKTIELKAKWRLT